MNHSSSCPVAQWHNGSDAEFHALICDCTPDSATDSDPEMQYAYQPLHVLSLDDDGDGWNEPYSEHWVCSCGRAIFSWVQTEPRCLDRPLPEDIYRQHAIHAEQSLISSFTSLSPSINQEGVPAMTVPTISIVIYGASDDLVEVDGDIPPLEGGGYDKVSSVLVNGAIVATAEYDNNGIWRITPTETMPDGIEAEHTPAIGPDERRHPGTQYSGYSELLRLTGPIWKVEVPDDEWERKS